MAIAHITASDLASVARNGGGVTVSASRVTASDLASIARNLMNSAVLHVTDSARLTASDMGSIARNAKAPAYVMFS